MTPWEALAVLAVFAAVGSSAPGRALYRLGQQSSERVWIGWRFTPGATRGGVLFACAAWILAGGGVLPLGVGAGVAVVYVVVRRLATGWKVRRQRRSRQLAVIDVCDALSAEFRAGLPAVQAIERSFDAHRGWRSIVAAARLGGDVPEAMRRMAGEPGADGLRAVAAGWEVAHHSGAALAAVLDRVAIGLRSDEEARSEVIASLGPPRATAKMLAVLPVFGLALGSSMGARPVGFLFSTGVGAACLTSGLVLASLGIFWVERLAASAEV